MLFTFVKLLLIMFYSLMFGIIILNFVTNDKIKKSLENRYLTTYGIFIRFVFVSHNWIVLALAITNSINFSTKWLLYPLSFILTIIIAELSFKYFESFFLNFKYKFSNIISGNAIKEQITSA